MATTACSPLAWQTNQRRLALNNPTRVRPTFRVLASTPPDSGRFRRKPLWMLKMTVCLHKQASSLNPACCEARHHVVLWVTLVFWIREFSSITPSWRGDRRYRPGMFWSHSRRDTSTAVAFGRACLFDRQAVSLITENLGRSECASSVQNSVRRSWTRHSLLMVDSPS